jgi:hypothetical protein
VQLIPRAASRKLAHWVWRYRFAAAAVLLVLLVYGACEFTVLTPDGAYYDRFIASSEPTYWVFRDGKVVLREHGAVDVPAGSYRRVAGTWVLEGDPKIGRILLKPSLFGIRTIAPPETYMNRFLPRKGFVWLHTGLSGGSEPPLDSTGSQTNGL